MKTVCVAAVFAACAFAQSNHLDKLQGAWNIVSVTVDGAPLGPEELRQAKLTIAGNRFTATGMGDAYEGAIEVDSSATPKVIRLHFTAGPEKGNTNEGIFEFDGDRWRLCLNMRGGPRPAKFASEPGTGLALEVLERAAVSDLEGEWHMESGTFDGQPVPAAYAHMGKRVVAGNEMTVTFGSELYSKATFTVDRGKSPAAIDIQNTAGANAGKTQLGIYERSGNTLKLSLAAPGQERPGDFGTTPGDGRTVVLWTLK